ncbi:TM1812 family CRISPR-associated protein [Desulfonema magnum]|nr:TM1812 family CRISPR-associated protein [Desulfonema magnum]
MSDFGGNLVGDGIHAARWCLEHNLIQQGYTILQETLVSYFVSGIDEKPEDLKDKNREVSRKAARIRDISTQAVKICRDSLPENKWAKPAADHPEVTRKFLAFYGPRKELLEVFNKLSNYRNDLNHAGYRQNPMKSDSFEKNLAGLIKSIERYGFHSAESE